MKLQVQKKTGVGMKLTLTFDVGVVATFQTLAIDDDEAVAATLMLAHNCAKEGAGEEAAQEAFQKLGRVLSKKTEGRAA